MANFVLHDLFAFFGDGLDHFANRRPASKLLAGQMLFNELSCTFPVPKEGIKNPGSNIKPGKRNPGSKMKGASHES